MGGPESLLPHPGAPKSREAILPLSLCEFGACSGRLFPDLFQLPERVSWRHPLSEFPGGKVRLREGQGLAPGHPGASGPAPEVNLDLLPASAFPSPEFKDAESAGREGVKRTPNAKGRRART